MMGDKVGQQMEDKTERNQFEVVRIELISGGTMSELKVEVFESGATETLNPIACRVIVTASNGNHPDGSGSGVYADGRFFCEGSFAVSVPGGPTTIEIGKGPSYLPFRETFEAVPGERKVIRVHLQRWFSPEDKGWYSGDNHVHSQHDAIAQQTTGLYYTALQGRANGLSFITEAGSHVTYEHIDEMSTDDFLLRYAHEVRQACYTGHLNTPGLKEQFDEEELERFGKVPLSTQAVVEAAHSQGAVVTYTHPLAPPHQIHWMGAVEAVSDAVIRKCADLFDIDSKATELLWFAMLNLGNRVGCSSYTDSALERPNTLTPGSRRIYCHAASFTYEAMIGAMRASRTFATNGGPLFVFFTIDGQEPGSVIDRSDTPDTQPLHCHVEIHNLYPIRGAELIADGNVITLLDVEGEGGSVAIDYEINEPEHSWYVVRVEDVYGNWAITSPVYVRNSASAREREEDIAPAAAIAFEISNHTRYIYLSEAFFAHLMVTVSPHESIETVTLCKDGEVWKHFSSTDGNNMPDGRVPVTELEEGAEYQTGWIWHHDNGQTLHFQADAEVTETGWYSVEVRTTTGRRVQSDSVYFDENSPHSHELSLLQLEGESTHFVLWGYGEEMPLNEVKGTQEDRWWYPVNPAWRIAAEFGGQRYELFGEHGYDPNQLTNELSSRLVTRFKGEFF